MITWRNIKQIVDCITQIILLLTQTWIEREAFALNQSFVLYPRRSFWGKVRHTAGHKCLVSCYAMCDCVQFGWVACLSSHPWNIDFECVWKISRCWTPKSYLILILLHGKQDDMNSYGNLCGFNFGFDNQVQISTILSFHGRNHDMIP